MGLEHFKLQSVEYAPIEGVKKEDNKDIKDKDSDRHDGKAGKEDEDSLSADKSNDNKEYKSSEQESSNSKESKEGKESDNLEEQKKEMLSSIKSKEEKDRTEEEKKFLEDFGDDSDSPFKSLINNLSDKDIVLVDEDKEYGDGLEAVGEVINDTVSARVKELKQSYPEPVKNLLSFIDNGGTFEDYANILFEEKYEDVDVESEINQKLLVRDLMSVQGREEADINEQIEILEEKGKLKKEAEVAKKILSKAQKDKESKVLKDQEDAYKRTIDSNKKSINDFSEKVSNLTEVAGTSLTKKEAKKLATYMTVPVSNGRTQWQIDAAKFDNKVKQAYFSMLKFDMSALQKKSDSKSTAKLRKSLDQLSKGVAAKKGSNSNTTVPEESTSEDKPIVIPKLRWLP